MKLICITELGHHWIRWQLIANLDVIYYQVDSPIEWDRDTTLSVLQNMFKSHPVMTCEMICFEGNKYVCGTSKFISWCLHRASCIISSDKIANDNTSLKYVFKSWFEFHLT